MKITTKKLLLSLFVTTALSACGGGGSSSSSSVSNENGAIGGSETSQPANTKPVANIDSDSDGVIGETVTLNGGDSTDADEDALSYQWQIQEMPEGSEATLSGAETQSSSFVPDAAGSYTIQLTVNDGEESSEPTTFTIDVTSALDAPQAEISESGELIQGATITLDGSASSFDTDAENQLTYLWSIVQQPEGADAALEDAKKAAASFVPDLTGSYIIALTVTDTQGNTGMSEVELEIGENLAPTADVAVDFDYIIGTEAYAYASVADEDNESHDYRWSFSSVPEGSALSDFSFTKKYLAFVPDSVGDYQVNLTVSDGVNSVTASPVTLTIAERDGYELSVDGPTLVRTTVNEPVLIDFSSSISPTGSELSFSKYVRSGPSGSMPSLTTSIIHKAETEFESNLAGTYWIKVTATNEEGASDTKDIQVIVYDAGTNLPPVPKSTVPKRVALGNDILVDASSTYDPEGDTIKYWWQMWSKPTYSDAKFSAPHRAQPENSGFTVPGIYYVRNQPKDNVSSKMVNTTHAMVVYDSYSGVGINDIDEMTAVAGETMTLPASLYGELEENDELVWNILAAPYNSSETIVNNTQLNPDFTFDAKGKYVLQLRLMREDLVYDVEHLVVRVSDNHSPKADAGEDLTVTTGETVTLDGTGSADQDDNLTYSWKVVGAEWALEDLPVFEDNTIASPKLVFGDDYTGQLVIRLTVSDGVNAPVSDEVLIEVAED